MPIPILLNVPSATQSYIADCKLGMDVAKARGYSGVRFSAGLSGYGNNPSVNTTYVSQAVQYAQSIGLSQCSILLNLGPKYNGAYIQSLNGGAPLQVPTLPSNTAVLDYVAQGWQSFIDACRLVAPDSFLEFEWLNEPGIGGNQAPKDKNGTYTSYSGPDGTIVPQVFTSLEYVSSRVDFHACSTVCFTLEGNGTSTAQTEVNSIAGPEAVSVVARATHIGTNRYADAPSTPYSSAATKSAFSSKLQQQLTRMAANPVIGSKAVKVREFGFNMNRTPSCIHANAVRNDLVAQMKAETGVADAAFFCCFDVTGNIGDGQPYWFRAYNRDKSPLAGIVVGP